MYINGHKKCTKNRKSLETKQEKQEKTYFVHFCTCTFGKNLVAKQEKTYFVHFCTFLYMYIWQKSGGQTGKNIFCTFLYMYIWQKSGGHVQKCSWTPPPPYNSFKRLKTDNWSNFEKSKSLVNLQIYWNKWQNKHNFGGCENMHML